MGTHKQTNKWTNFTQYSGISCSVCFMLLYSQSAAYHASASFLPPPSLLSLFIFLFATHSLHVLDSPPQKKI